MITRWPLLVTATLAMLLLGSTASSSDEPAPLPKPTVAQMGVPEYPGATYDGMASAGMSMNEQYLWIFLSNDPVAKVAQFYQDKTSKKPTITGSYYIFKLQGDGLLPDHGVTIEPNKMFPGPAKTVITVIRNK